MDPKKLAKLEAAGWYATLDPRDLVDPLAVIKELRNRVVELEAKLEAADSEWAASLVRIAELEATKKRLLQRLSDAAHEYTKERTIHYARVAELEAYQRHAAVWMADLTAEIDRQQSSSRRHQEALEALEQIAKDETYHQPFAAEVARAALKAQIIAT